VTWRLFLPALRPPREYGKTWFFDFTSKTGVYPTISFMPDFEDPLTLTSDIVIYFDDILLNNDPNPIVAGLPVGQKTNDVTIYPVPFNNFLVINTTVDLKSVIHYFGHWPASG